MEKNTKKTSKKTSKKKSPIIEEQKIEIISKTPTKSISDILNDYIINYIQFKIFLKNELLFDTKNTLRKNYPIFKKNYFSIGENKYIYKGIRIELY